MPCAGALQLLLPPLAPMEPAQCVGLEPTRCRPSRAGAVSSIE